jgi:predicted DNA-binding transcriptional regulator YafY
MEFIFFIVIAFVIYYVFNKTDSPPKKDETIQSSLSRVDSPPKKDETIKSPLSRNYVKTPSANYLQNCIDNRERLSFTYIDNDGVITERTATPGRIFWGYSNREGSGKKIRTCWIEAHCHLRNDQRTFIKDRMSNVKIL